MNRLPLRKSLVAVALGTGLLLLIPLVAMQITDEVSWGVIDFLAAGTLLFGAGAAVVVALRRFERPVQRAKSRHPRPRSCLRSRVRDP